MKVNLVVAFLVGAALPIASGLSGCATPYPALTAVAKSGSAAVAAFETFDHDHKRELLAAHPECQRLQPDVTMVADCYRGVLAPYTVERDKVFVVIAELTPAVREAAKVAEQGAADGLAARIAALAAKVLAAVAQLRGAP